MVYFVLTLPTSSHFNKESIVWVSHSSSVLKLFGALMLLVHWWHFVAAGYEFLDGSVMSPSTCCLASWNGMFFWYFTLMISFSIFHLGQLLGYAGWSPLQLAHFASFSHSWLSCPACPHFANFGWFLQYLLLWPYFWQLKQHCGFGIYTFVSQIRKPILIWGGMFGLFMVNMYESEGTNWPSFCLFMHSSLIPVQLCPLHPYFSVLYIQSHILKNWVLFGCHFNK